MSVTPDSTYDFIIGATVGKARITGVTAPPTAQVGAQIYIKVDLINDGGTDKLWCQIKDKTTGTVINDVNGYPCKQVTGTAINSGSTSTHSFTVKMPNTTIWSLRAEAGHGTTAGLLLDTTSDFGVQRGIMTLASAISSALSSLGIPRIPTLELPTVTWTDLSMAMGFIGIATVGAVIAADQLMRR